MVLTWSTKKRLPGVARSDRPPPNEACGYYVKAHTFRWVLAVIVFVVLGQQQQTLYTAVWKEYSYTLYHQNIASSAVTGGLLPTTCAMPQIVPLGPMQHHSALPFISIDVWYELVDNNTTFFLRPQDFTGPQLEEDYWLSWLDKCTAWPVTLLMNNNLDWSFPDDNIPITVGTLDHPNLRRLYAMNPVLSHPKLFPLPIGPKWQWRSTQLYGESKDATHTLLHSVASSPAATRDLFRSPHRTATVWLRPATRRRRAHYNRTFNAALGTPRSALRGILEEHAPNTTVVTDHKLSPEALFGALRTHRFVICAPGVGLDTHLVYEAWLAGCIPIVPASPGMQHDQRWPVWQVDDWADVTDVAVAAKSREFLEHEWRWDLVFAEGWARELAALYQQ